MAKKCFSISQSNLLSRLGNLGAISLSLMASDIQILPSNLKKDLLLSISAGQSTKPPKRCSPVTQGSPERLKMDIF